METIIKVLRARGRLMAHVASFFTSKRRNIGNNGEANNNNNENITEDHVNDEESYNADISGQLRVKV